MQAWGIVIVLVVGVFWALTKLQEWLDTPDDR